MEKFLYRVTFNRSMSPIFIIAESITNAEYLGKKWATENAEAMQKQSSDNYQYKAETITSIQLMTEHLIIA